MQRKVLFIVRDGTLIKEPPVNFQVDLLEQLTFLPGVIRHLYFIRKKLDFELVMVIHPDEPGTSAYPQKNFNSVQEKMLALFAGEGIFFDNILIDTSFRNNNSPNGKLKTDVFKNCLAGDYDLSNSYIISNREVDMQLAEMLGCKGILFDSWDQIKAFLFAGERQTTVKRITSETDIQIHLNLDGNGVCDISTGIGFFDHLLEQIGKHSGLDLKIKVTGDWHVDEHHTIEDTAIALGEAVYQALGNKRGIERYGFCLPMDDCLCHVALDFGGRAWLVWDVTFKREKIGDMPTEMIYHFFKSFSDAAKMNLYIKVEGENEHHKAESIFKSFARAIKAAVKRDVYKYDLPSTKGVL